MIEFKLDYVHYLILNGKCFHGREDENAFVFFKYKHDLWQDALNPPIWNGMSWTTLQ